MNTQYDLAISYRVYPGISKTPWVHADDKLKLAELGLRSLATATKGLKVRLHAILDGCPNEYRAMILRHFSNVDTEIVETAKIGNHATFLMQGSWLMDQPYSENVYFAEDDYWYRPHTFPKLIEFLNSKHSVDFITPYDHIDYYEHPLHGKLSDTIQFAGISWRSVSTTCLSFLTKRETLKKTWNHLRAYAEGSTDAAVWTALTRQPFKNPVQVTLNSLRSWDLFTIYARALLHSPKQVLLGPSFRLWCPVPGTATHLESTGISPGFTREEILRTSTETPPLP